METTVKIGQVRRAGAVGNFIEYFDTALYGFSAVTLAKLFFPEVDPVAGLLSTFALFGVSFVVRPLGALLFGHIGDRWGRKSSLISSILLMSAATAAVGLLPTYSAAGILAPILLLIARLLQGFSTGGEATTALVLVAEHSRIHNRGRNIAPLISSTIASSAAVSLVAMLISIAVPADVFSSWAWRVPFLLAVPLGVVGLILRLHVDDAEVYKSVAERPRVTKTPLLRAFREVKKEMFVLFLWVAMQATSGYITISYMPTQLMHFNKHSMAGTYGIIVVALAIAAAAMFALGRLAGRISRKKLATWLAAALIVWTYPAFVLINHNFVVATIALAILATVQFGTMLSSGLAVVELFPVEIRATASALPYAVAFSVFGGTAPFVATWLASTFSPTAPALYIVLLAAVGLVVGWLGIPDIREKSGWSDDRAVATPAGEPEQTGRSHG